MTQVEMLEQLMALQFTCIDLGQYLDTHPTDENAIAYFNDYKAEWEKLWQEYEETFEPLTAGSNQPTRWQWIENPWPWENLFE